MSDRSLEVSKMTFAATEKYDYFICGVTGALFAYIAQTYSPQKIGINISSLEPLSLLLLVAAFFTGLMRIQHFNLIGRLNYAFLDATEKVQKIAAKLSSTTADTFHDEFSGEDFNRQTLLDRRQQYINKATEANVAIEENRRHLIRYGKARDVFLVLGFLTIFSAKVLQPYQDDFDKHPTIISPKTNLSSPAG
jgi:hypothetical protein